MACFCHSLPLSSSWPRSHSYTKIYNAMADGIFTWVARHGSQQKKSNYDMMMILITPTLFWCCAVFTDHYTTLSLSSPMSKVIKNNIPNQQKGALKYNSFVYCLPTWKNEREKSISPFLVYFLTFYWCSCLFHFIIIIIPVTILPCFLLVI